MPLSKISSAQHHLFRPHLVSVETDLSRGLHTFSIVGLPDKAVEESKDRVSAAIKNSGFKSPKQANVKITVSLAPADLRKEGPTFDMPMALGYLLAAGEISFDPKGRLFIGELALDGSVRSTHGALSYARMARDAGLKEIYVPKANASEAALVSGIDVFAIQTLRQAIDHLSGQAPLSPTQATIEKAGGENGPVQKNGASVLDSVVGQEVAKRGLAIAAAGRHNIALFGPPGTGKTLLSKAFAEILPDLSFEEMLEVAEVYSMAGDDARKMSFRPPFRSPHHTSSYSSVIGGGSSIRPGEITLAHRGALFLDEFPEFDARTIEALRQPLEDREISIARAQGSVRLPADFILIVAFNPCPCGNRGVKGKTCSCTPKDISRYARKISGPIMDRIDMWIEVSNVDYEGLARMNRVRSRGAAVEDRSISSAAHLRRLVEKARERRQNRPADGIAIETDAESTLIAAATSYGISARSYQKTLRLAQTIADIEASDHIKTPHVLEALQYRFRQKL